MTRPTSPLLTSHKLFMKRLVYRYMLWIVETERLQITERSHAEKLLENVLCSWSEIADFLHSSSTYYVAFCDIRDAFESTGHETIINELSDAAYPTASVDSTRDIAKAERFRSGRPEGWQLAGALQLPPSGWRCWVHLASSTKCKMDPQTANAVPVITVLLRKLYNLPNRYQIQPKSSHITTMKHCTLIFWLLIPDTRTG